MKFIKLNALTRNGNNTLLVNTDAIQCVEEIRTAYPHELNDDEQNFHQAIMTSIPVDGHHRCTVKLTPTSRRTETVQVAGDCKAIYLITLKDGSVYICDGHLV